jgi:hypothetical protein
MKNINNIIVHCSDSVFGDRNEIDKWHRARGFSEIGYHFVVLNGRIGPNFRLASLDGSIEPGRYLDGDSLIAGNEVGAHALGYNGNSVGICLIGTRTFTDRQMAAVVSLVRELLARYGIDKSSVLGHYETDSGRREGKTCPNIDMALFREQL